MSRLGRVNFHERRRPRSWRARPVGRRARLQRTDGPRDRRGGAQDHRRRDAARCAAFLLSRRAALEAIAQRLIEKEVMDGTELRQLLEQHIPGPRLVPGSEALHGPPVSRPKKHRRTPRRAGPATDRTACAAERSNVRRDSLRYLSSRRTNIGAMLCAESAAPEAARRSSSTSSASRGRCPSGRRPGHTVIAVMPAYNAERTLAATLADMPAGCVDEIILVDDGSKDRTVEVAREMGLTVIVHSAKPRLRRQSEDLLPHALEHGADIVVMIHPDYQYDSRVIPHAVGFIELGICDVVLGSRIRSRAGGAGRRHAGLQVRQPIAS